MLSEPDGSSAQESIFDVFSAFSHNLWQEEAKMSKENSLFSVLAFFVLFPFLIVGVPEYDEWEDLNSCDCLGPFVIRQNSGAFQTIDIDSSIVCSSAFCSKIHPMQYRTYSHPFTSELILSVTLRC